MLLLTYLKFQRTISSILLCLPRFLHLILRLVQVFQATRQALLNIPEASCTALAGSGSHICSTCLLLLVLQYIVCRIGGSRLIQRPRMKNLVEGQGKLKNDQFTTHASYCHRPEYPRSKAFYYQMLYSYQRAYRAQWDSWKGDLALHSLNPTVTGVDMLSKIGLELSCKETISRVQWRDVCFYFLQGICRY